jgi:hypothetical protein
MFCVKCGTDNPEGAAFCKKCGASLEVDEATVNNGKITLERPDSGSTAKAAESSAKTASSAKSNSGEKPKKKRLGCLLAVLAILIIFIIAVGSSCGNNSKTVSTSTSNKSVTSSASSASSASNNAAATTAATTAATEPSITYEKIGVDELYDELDSNALRAETNYQDKYIEFTGYLSGIDSDGKYFSVAASDGLFADSIHCSFISEEPKKVLMTKNSGDMITVRGKVTTVGEILGFYVDVIEIVG